MERWGATERVCVCVCVRACVRMCGAELFIRTGSVLRPQHGFCHEVRRHAALSPNAIRRWVRPWREEDSVACRKSPGRPPTVRTSENFALVLASVGRSLMRSASLHAQAWGMSDRSVRRFLHIDLSLYPYKLQIVILSMIGIQRYAYNFIVISRVYWVKIQTCRTTFWWAMKHIFFCKAQLISRNLDTRRLKILTKFTKSPLWPKFTVCSAVWSRGVTGPYFFADEDGQAITVTSKCYTEIIIEFLAPKLPQNHNLWFQQNGAKAHTAVISMAVLHLLFPQRVISRFGDVPWSPLSPDLTAPLFFFCVCVCVWGCLKSEVYSRRPVDLNALKQAIWDAIVNISEETLRIVMRNSCASLHSGGWWPPKRQCTQKAKQCKTTLSTLVNRNVLKLSLITFNKMLFMFIISSLFLRDPVKFHRNLLS